VEKELEILEKLQNKYNKIEAKRKKLAKQNYEQVKTAEIIRFFITNLVFSRFQNLLMHMKRV
jgi:hypothetical protein